MDRDARRNFEFFASTGRILALALALVRVVAHPASVAVLRLSIALHSESPSQIQNQVALQLEVGLGVDLQVKVREYGLGQLPGPNLGTEFWRAGKVRRVAQSDGGLAPDLRNVRTPFSRTAFKISVIPCGGS